MLTDDEIRQRFLKKSKQELLALLSRQVPARTRTILLQLLQTDAGLEGGQSQSIHSPSNEPPPVVCSPRFGIFRDGGEPISALGWAAVAVFFGALALIVGVVFTIMTGEGLGLVVAVLGVALAVIGELLHRALAPSPGPRRIIGFIFHDGEFWRAEYDVEFDSAVNSDGSRAINILRQVVLTRIFFDERRAKALVIEITGASLSPDHFDLSGFSLLDGDCRLETRNASAGGEWVFWVISDQSAWRLRHTMSLPTTENLFTSLEHVSGVLSRPELTAVQVVLAIAYTPLSRDVEKASSMLLFGPLFGGYQAGQITMQESTARRQFEEMVRQQKLVNSKTREDIGAFADRKGWQVEIVKATPHDDQPELAFPAV